MEKSSLAELAGDLLVAARGASSGRSAQTVHGGHAGVLRQTVIALAAGQRLDEHENPGDATLQVLIGQVRLTSGEDGCDLTAGELVVIPQARHALAALDDSVILLTVAKLA
ncbi:cupin domain-containing protein [Actinoplanes sp. KI2]|uniref:cupin domain-containing protein n=1 Tax=Actinoplanes sp. KI2 TaxID=2983315 RepID=UPI0021D5D93D|nr:cupin domain-containing protein [Actinoplanes sp. KI2]MCU7730598.1 cupin domain-containing protein [Actinoplanes sp. KI2]